jgi:hypothetical protein
VVVITPQTADEKIPRQMINFKEVCTCENEMLLCSSCGSCSDRHGVREEKVKVSSAGGGRLESDE